MKYAFNPREWHDCYVWIAEDLLTLSTKRFVPENYQHNGILYDGHTVYTPQGLSKLEGLEALACDVRDRMTIEVRESHYQQLVITYAQAMYELERLK